MKFMLQLILCHHRVGSRFFYHHNNFCGCCCYSIFTIELAICLTAGIEVTIKRDVLESIGKVVFVNICARPAKHNLKQSRLFEQYDEKYSLARISFYVSFPFLLENGTKL